MTKMKPKFASAGSQRWLQVAVAKAPELLDEALCRAGAIEDGDAVHWMSPLESDRYSEYRDEEALRRLGITELVNRPLSKFWPRRGPVWDALGKSRHGRLILVEVKAHIPEAASPACKASEPSLAIIRQSMTEARGYYTPRSTADWSGSLYQYANRLAFQYLLAEVNGLPSRLIFLYFLNAADVGGPESEAEWRGAERLVHALLGLPADLKKHGVFTAHMDASVLASLL